MNLDNLRKINSRSFLNTDPFNYNICIKLFNYFRAFQSKLRYLKLGFNLISFFMFIMGLKIGLLAFPALIQQSKLGIARSLAFACLEFIQEGF